MAVSNPGMLVVWNPTDERVEVDFSAEIPEVTDEVTVQLFSKSYNETGVVPHLKQDSHKVPISAQAAIVLSYVPKASES